MTSNSDLARRWRKNSCSNGSTLLPPKSTAHTARTRGGSARAVQHSFWKSGSLKLLSKLFNKRILSSRHAMAEGQTALVAPRGLVGFGWITAARSGQDVEQASKRDGLILCWVAACLLKIFVGMSAGGWHRNHSDCSALNWHRKPPSDFRYG